MEFRYSSEQHIFQESVRTFCEREVAPIAPAIAKGEAAIPTSLIKGLAALGVFGITIPEKYGGSAPQGEELSYAALAIHELAKSDMSMSLPVYTLLCLGWGLMVAKHGSAALKGELLPQIARGEKFIGIATTESAGGSDVANIKTHAKVDGDSLIINGEKSYISGIKEAYEKRGGGHLTLVRTDPKAGHKGFTFIFIPAGLKGIEHRTMEEIGRLGLSSGSLYYRDVRVPKDNIIGEIDGGFYMNMEGFNLARVLVSSACVGMAEKALEISRDYVKERRVFGRPLAKFEGISFEIAEDHARLEQLKHYLRYTAWAADTLYKEGTLSQRELSKMVSICKLSAPKLGAEIVQHCMTHLGAASYTKECPLGAALQGVISYLVGAEGGYHIQKLIIAREFIGEEAVPYR